MESQWRVFNGREHSCLPEPVQQSFLFVDADQQKASRQGRRNARSFVMQKARKERPWSTSKQTAKQKIQGRTSSRSVGTSESSYASSEKTPSPHVMPIRADYGCTAERDSRRVSRLNVCLVCQSFFCQPNNRTYCPTCQPAPAKDPNSTLHDPFQAASVPLDKSVLDLLKHCE
jgi:hypothetical protein